MGGPEPALGDGRMGIDGALEDHLVAVRIVKADHEKEVGIFGR